MPKHGNKVKFFGIVLAIVSGLYFVAFVATPILLNISGGMVEESIELLKSTDGLVEIKSAKEELEDCKTDFVESKGLLEELETEILRFKGDIQSHNSLIEREKKLIENYNNKLKENQSDIKEYELKIEKAKATVESTDLESKIYNIRVAGYQKDLSYYNTLKKRRSDIEKESLKLKENIKKYKKSIIRIEENIKSWRKHIPDLEQLISRREQSLREALIKQQSSDESQEEVNSIEDLEKSLASLEQRFYSPMNIGLLLFHSFSMLLFLIIAKSWIAKDPFSKRVIKSFRLLGVLWIGHAILTLLYHLEVILDPNTLEGLRMQNHAMPNYGNMDSLIAGLLFLCLSYIIDHGSQMLEDTSLTV